jgi:hypothetical protein
VSPKLKSLLARATLLGGVALLATFAANQFPREQTLVIRLGSRDIARLEGVVTELGEQHDSADGAPTAGFSRIFPEKSPRVVRYAFKAATGTYIVVINMEERVAGDTGPKLTETTFERRVSLAGGEVIVSPD